ncbi:amino acid permease 6-like isoform X2 [Asparagus officinalis]|nr:amino acid permease 6-like isoform X2 [Asparagus officinalis]XP_020257878.1 amino acid permease 6-like isoform X2 [Asparagus officinalis]
MAIEVQGNGNLREVSFEMAGQQGLANGDLDDDGHAKRTGTLVTASAYIITAVIGSGVLSLAWAMAQLGWVIGLLVLVSFSFITWHCSTLQADCYRSPDPIHGRRNYTYMEAVKTNLGGVQVQLCGLVQYANLVGVTISYAITTAISMAAVKRSYCFHKNGHNVPCDEPLNVYVIIFASTEIVLSQIPNFHKIWWLSIMAAVMSFSYSLIGLGLSIAKIAEGNSNVSTSLTGLPVGMDLSSREKVWKMLQALGNVASAFSFALVLIEIQDTLKSSPPENKTMKKSALIGVSTTTVFYMLCGVTGYLAFGNAAPGNFLTGFGFYEPFWLIDIGNICIVIHLLGGYQVFCQPVFQFVENWSGTRWHSRGFFTSDHIISVPLLGSLSFNITRVIWRTVYVIITAVVAMTFPFFNSFVGFVGGVAFWPLTVYFPVEMYISQAKVQRFSGMWIWLKIMSLVCLVVSLAAACGSLQGLIHDLREYKPFRNF